ncbi:MAG: hypothetical protein KJ747_09265 [Actinobacteria bacterium]|nr:hypothetical protein [Actinomycetota bacterium]MCG2808384.1 hypothetical protein [Coriobacteriia bacterium]
MILGYEIQLANIIAGGIVLFALLVFQMLVGLRVIHFKGKTHLKVHKWAAWALIAFALVHGSLALLFFVA